MDEQKQDGQLELIYNSSVPVWDVASKTYREQRMIETGSEKRSGRSVLAERHDDDDDDVSNSISAVWNENSLVQVLNSGHHVHFLWWKHYITNMCVCVCVCVWFQTTLAKLKSSLV